MSVKLRKRKNKDGSTSLYLDIYENYRRRYEFLNECKLEAGSSPAVKAANKARLSLAEQIATKTALTMQAQDYSIKDSIKRQSLPVLSLFDAFLMGYKKKDARLVRACYAKFRAFLAETSNTKVSTKSLSKSLLIDFKAYLEDQLNGETPINYFKKLKMVLAYGVREGYFDKNPAEGIALTRQEGIAKEVLDYKEIRLLYNTPCGNETVKRAFLFCLNTGLRFGDVKDLTWSSIQGGVLKITQNKTRKVASVNLNEVALALLELKSRKKANELVFDLPSHTACNKLLATWCKRAGVSKHITWHCARHSFATNLIIYGGDVNTVKSLLGHSSYAYTIRYVREVEKLKVDAVHNLPSLGVD